MSEQETEQPQPSQPSEPEQPQATEPDPEGGTPMGSPDAAQDAELADTIPQGMRAVLCVPLFVGEEFVMEGRPVQWVALAAANYSPFAHQCAARPFLVSRVRPAN